MAKILGEDYITSFFGNHPTDYAREPIIYPRVSYYRRYNSSDIAHGRKRTPFCTHPLPLRKCTPTLLEYHLYKTRKHNRCEAHEYWSKSHQEFIVKYTGPHWILTTYYDDSVVDFCQIDIDRHGDDDTDARRYVSRIQQASQAHGFDVVWTTSPGHIANGSVRHGLYAWIKLSRLWMVMDLIPPFRSFLSSIGLNQIVVEREASFLRQKRLTRLPGQRNVELACPDSFQKLFDHDAVEANQAFQEAWRHAAPLTLSHIVESETPETAQHEVVENAPPDIRHISSDTHEIGAFCDATDDTFVTMLKWGRPIVNRSFPDDRKRGQCIEQLKAYVRDNLRRPSRTRDNPSLLHHRATQVVDYLWTHTSGSAARRAVADNEDRDRFKPHADFLEQKRKELIESVPQQLRPATAQILEMMIQYDGRLAATVIYHPSGQTRVCNQRQWMRIRECLRLVELVDYEKPDAGRGKCKQWGFQDVL
jgi:hypothetical protein